MRSTIHRFGNTTHVLPALTISLRGKDEEYRKEVGNFETWICLGCGYTELYAGELKGIEELAKKHPEQVRIVDARPPEQGPYR